MHQRFNGGCPPAMRALALVHAEIARFAYDPRVSQDLPYYVPYYEALVRRAGGIP